MTTLPEDWALIPIVATFLDFYGRPASGRIYFEAQQTVIIDGEIIVPTRIHCDLVDGSIPDGFTLPSTNDPDILKGSGFAYKVTENHSGGRAPYWISVPFDGGPINLATVSPVVPPPQLVSTQGLSAYQVAVVNGFVGTQAEWLASLVGPIGPSGVQSFNMVASGPIDYPRVVAADAQGRAYIPDLSIAQDVANIVGISTSLAMQAGDQISVVSSGQITEQFWTWIEGIIFCTQTGGQLTQTPAPSAYVPVARALGPTSLSVSIQTPTLRL